MRETQKTPEILGALRVKESCLGFQIGLKKSAGSPCFPACIRLVLGLRVPGSLNPRRKAIPADCESEDLELENAKNA